MATDYYVDSRNGNDSSDGLSWANAKKTFAAMWAAAADTSTTLADPNKMYLVGVFGERLALDTSGLQSEYWEIHAQGFAIFDRGFGAGNQEAWWVAYSGYLKKIYGITFKGYTNSGGYSSDRMSPDLYDCVFDGQGVSPYGINHNTYDDGSNYFRCTFKNHSGAGVRFYNQNPAYRVVKVHNCTIVGNPIGVECALTSTAYLWWFDIQNCIFRTNTSHIKTTGATANNIIGGSTVSGPSANGNTFSFNNNNVDFSSGNVIAFNNSDVLTTFTSLATWAVPQNHGSAVGSDNAPDEFSISQDPKFIDESKELYGLAPDSGSLSAGALGIGSIIQGAWDEYAMEGISQTRNTSLWTGATLTNCEINGDNNIVLSSGQSEGTAVFTYDFGAQRTIKRLDLSFLYGWDTSILDYDESDTLPETWSFRYRTSPDSTPTWGAWTTANWLSDLNLTGVYVLGLEITLRNDA